MFQKSEKYAHPKKQNPLEKFQNFSRKPGVWGSPTPASPKASPQLQPPASAAAPVVLAVPCVGVPHLSGNKAPLDVHSVWMGFCVGNHSQYSFGQSM